MEKKKVNSSLYAIKNDYSDSFKIFCKKYDKRLKKDYNYYFSKNNELEVSFEIFCHLSYWASRMNFYDSNLFENYFKFKDGKFQFCNYLLDFIEIFATDFVMIPETYPQEFVDLFLKNKSKSLKDKTYKASYYLLLAMLRMENIYKEKIINNNKTIRETIKNSSYYISLSKKNKEEFNKAIIDKIEVININESITARNKSLEKKIGEKKNLIEPFIEYYKINKDLGKVEMVFSIFIKNYPKYKDYKWESFRKLIYAYGFKLK